MVEINNFILNSDFASEKIINMPTINMAKSISGGSRTGNQLLGYTDYIVPSGDYIISAIHSNTYNSKRYSGIYGYYFDLPSDDGPSFPFHTFGEIIQTSKTNIRLNVWLIVSGGGSCTVPSFIATAKVKLAILPLSW